MERILRSRGLCDPDEVRRFCDPKLTDLHAPGQMPNIDAAAERLVAALRADEPIVIYGDYDVDGMTATAVLFHLMKALQPAARIRTYVPHRIDEGYGLNSEALRALAADGARVIVTVDCGITAVEESRLARELGIDLIVTDHHCPSSPDAPLPEAIVVHPAIAGSEYPFPELCGAGVAFKLAWRIATTWSGSERVGEALQRTLLDLLPFVALGTIADVVPLVGENRVLTSFGLRLLKASANPGLRALIEMTRLGDKQIDSDKVGFVIAPRLNACGRMGHAAEAVHMLTVADAAEALQIAERLDGLNNERRRTEQRIAAEAAERAIEAGMVDGAAGVIVLSDPDWHPGVIGIVCSRLAERFGRPAILLQDLDGTCRGSARSIDGYSIHDALRAASDCLDSFGGHAMAAGLALSSDRVDDLREALNAHARANLDPESMVPAIAIDCDANLGELDLPTVTRMRTLSPFGRSNRRPTVLVRSVRVESAARPLGANGKHLAVRLRDESDRRVVRAVWWNQGELVDQLVTGRRLDVAIEPKVNDWQGRTSVEAEIRDVRIVE